jgi:hypothetical protein
MGQKLICPIIIIIIITILLLFPLAIQINKLMFAVETCYAFHFPYCLISWIPLELNFQAPSVLVSMSDMYF